MDAKRIAAFYLGGMVAQERVGEVLAAFYGANAKEMQIDPVFNGVAVPGRAKALPAPPKKNLKDERMTAASALYKLLKNEGKPTPRKTLIVLLNEHGYNGKNISTPLGELVKQGKIKNVGFATYQAV